MKRNMPSELGWGSGTDGGWSQHSSAPGSGSWTSTANQDSTSSSWQAMNKSDSVSDPGDDASSGKSGATITSVSSATSQSQDATSTGNTGLLQTSSSNSWSPSNPTPTRQMDSGPWGSSSSPAPSGIGTIGWSSNPSSTSVSSNSQGHNSNVQPGSNIIGSSVGLSSGWQGSSIANTSTLPPSMSGGIQSNPLTSQWQGSTMLGDIGDFSKTSDAGWNNSSPSLVGNSKDLGGGGNSDSRMWGLSSDKTGGDSQWDTPKSQWGSTALAAVSDQAANNAEMSFAQATLKGLKTPPAVSVPQVVLSSRQEEILRAVENHEGWGSRPIRQDTSWDIETSPKSLRKFSSDGSAGVAAWNNSNGTTNWKNIRDNPSGGTEGGGVSGVASWNADKDQSNWGGQPKPSMDQSSWNVGNNVDQKTFGTWGAAGGAGDASNKMWGQKPETSWADRGATQRTPSISSWGEDGDTGAWDEQRRMASGMVGMQVMVPPSPGMNVPAGIPRMVPQGMPGVNMTAIGSDVTPWNDGQKPGWNSSNSVAVARTNMDEPWNKPPPTRSGWGDRAHEGVEVDNGTTLWTENVSKQGKAPNWGEAALTKPKVPAGWDEASWALAHRAKLQMPQKFVSSGSNPPTQMRAKLLQHLMDMGHRKEDAQNALITNNMNIDLALNDLKSGNVSVPRKDLDVDIFQANGTQARMPYMPKGGLGGEDMLDIRPDQVPPFHNMQNTPFTNPQMSSQPFMPSNASMPPSSLNLSNSSINSGLQQKLMQQQQVPPSAAMGQRVPMPSIASSASSQVPQKQQIRAQLHQAVNNGFISSQLMNYQLPHNILVLLLQLLQLQSAHQAAMSSQQQIMQQVRASGNRSNPQLEQMVGIITNISQQIINVQKQLQQAQNTFFSSQKPPAIAQPPPGTVTPQIGVNMGDSLDAISTDLANVALQSQSRLATQWKPATDASSGATSDITGTSTTPTTNAMKGVDENGENKIPGGKAVLQSSSPNMNLIPGGLGMTGDKTWSSSMSTTSSTNWPMAVDSTGPNSQTDLKASNSTRITSSLLSGLSSGTDVIPEFVPGKPWQGLTKNMDDDPHVTPGSIHLQRSLSVNRVHDDSLNHLDGYKLGSSSWGTSLKSDNNLGLSQLGNHPPPGMGLTKGVGTQQWSSAGVNRQASWPHSSNSAFTKVTGSSWNDNNVAPSSWIILKNLTVDPSTAHALSAQHGTPVSFYPLAQGQLALVQYSNRKIAYVAQQRLNNFQMGSSVIAAEFINEADAQRVIAQIPPPQPNTMPMMNASPWSQAPPFTPFQNTGVRSADPWSTPMPATQLNSKYGSSGENPWGLWGPDYNPNLLSNFLGGESM